MAALPPLPANLKPITSFIKLAKEYDKRDPTVAYFCRMYAVEKGMKLDSQSTDCRHFLSGLIGQLEQDKNVLIEKKDEAICNDIVAQAHIEKQTISLYTSADTEDRNGVFDKKVTKAFYTASLLFEVLTQFGEKNEETQLGELSEECNIMQKYSRWKATYLHRCSQTGENPVPGPEGSGFEDALGRLALGRLVTGMSALSNLPQPMNGHLNEHPNIQSNDQLPKDLPVNQQPENLPRTSRQPDTFSPVPVQATYQLPASQLDVSKLDVEQVQKLLKAAICALEYEDVGTAVGTLSGALNLLTKS